MPLRRGGAISGLPYQLLKGSRGIKQAFLRISLWAPTTSPRLPTEQPAFRHTSITSTSRSIVGSAVVARAFRSIQLTGPLRVCSTQLRCWPCGWLTDFRERNMNCPLVQLRHRLLRSVVKSLASSSVNATSFGSAKMESHQPFQPATSTGTPKQNAA